MIARKTRKITRKRNLSRNLSCATCRKIAGKLFGFFILTLAPFRVFSGLTFFPSLRFLVSTFCILHSSFLLAQTPYYHINRSFSSVQFDLQGIPTEYLLSEESDKLTDIVQGEIILNTNAPPNGTYAVEKRAVFSLGYGSALAVR